MATAEVTKIRLTCDTAGHSGHAIELDPEKAGELPKGWVKWGDHLFASIECFCDWMRQQGPITVGRRYHGSGDAKVKDLDHVLSIRARSYEEVVGCESCGGVYGNHTARCTTHR